MLQNEYLVAKIGVDPAENEPSKLLKEGTDPFVADREDATGLPSATVGMVAACAATGA